MDAQMQTKVSTAIWMRCGQCVACAALATEGHARSLTGLSPPAQVRIWKRALSQDHILKWMRRNSGLEDHKCVCFSSGLIWLCRGRRQQRRST